MAVFGVQVVLTMIVASFLHKISPYYSFGRWFITYRLSRFVAPTDDALKPHVSMATANHKTKKKNPNGAKGDQSTSLENLLSNNLDPKALLPKSSKIKLKEVPIHGMNFSLIMYTNELEWILNLILATVSVVVITELYYWLLPDALQTEYNLSTVWLFISIAYLLYILTSLTRVYMSEELAHQRSVCLVFTMLFFVLSLVLLLVDEGILDLGLDKTYINLMKCLTRLLGKYSEDSNEVVNLIPLWAFKISLAVVGGALSCVLVFPGLRFADVHFNALRYAQSKVVKAFLHAAYLSPFFCLSLWIRPLSSDMVAERNNVNMFGAFEVSYEMFRVFVVIGVCLFRMAMYFMYMQTYLNTAKWRADDLRWEHGKISVQDYRSRITNIFLFYGGMGVQYLAPYLLLLCTTLLVFASSRLDYASSVSGGLSSETNLFKFSGFGVNVFFGCFSFFSWWICLVQSVTTGIGAVLREYL